MSLDLKEYGIMAVCMHPGWVKTEMGGPKAPMDVETSVQNILNTLNNLTVEKNGSFLTHDGEALPW